MVLPKCRLGLPESGRSMITTIVAVEYAIGQVPAFYGAVGWGAYTNDPERLAPTVRNSTFVATAHENGQLVGLARALSDDVSIVYVQDVLVDPQHQRNGIGRDLLQRCLDHFSHVRQRVLLTDNEEHQHRL